jgi:hypothetical protein
MATAIQAATAFVTIRLERALFRREIQGANEDLNDVSNAAARAGGALLTMGIIGAAAIAKFTKTASDATEATNRFMQVFRDAGAGGALAWANSFAESVGRARTQVKDTLSTFQGFFVGLGFGANESERFSKSLTEAVVDFASFNNLADDDAMRRFIGALSGSPETLDKFGFNLREAAVNQELLAMGINKTTRTATEQQKAIAKMNIIMRTMGKLGATGDALRTADEFANVTKRLTSAWSNFSETVGQSTIPVLKEIYLTLTETIKSMEELNRVFPEITTGLLGMTGAMAAFGLAIIGFAVAIQTYNIIGSLQTMRIVGQSIGRMFTRLVAPIRAVITVTASAGRLFGGVMAAAFVTLISFLADATSAWYEYRKAMSESMELSKKQVALEKDRAEGIKGRASGEGPEPEGLFEAFNKGVDQFRAKKELDKLLGNTDKQIEDYKRQLETALDPGKSKVRGNFFLELFREGVKGSFGNYERGGGKVQKQEDTRRVYDQAQIKEMQMLLKEAEARKEDLEKAKKEIEEKEASDEKAKNLITEQDILKAMEDGVKKGWEGWKKIREKQIEKEKKLQEVFGNFVDDLKDGLNNLMRADQQDYMRAAGEIFEQRRRLQELNDVFDNRGAFGQKTTGQMQKMGGIFGVSSQDKERKEIESRIQAAKAIMRIFEQKYGKEWIDSMKRSIRLEQRFDTLMDKFGAI